MEQSEIRRRILGELAARDISGSELARRLDVSRAYISGLLHGDKQITLQGIATIMRAITGRTCDPARVLFRAYKARKDKLQ